MTAALCVLSSPGTCKLTFLACGYCCPRLMQRGANTAWRRKVHESDYFAPRASAAYSPGCSPRCRHSAVPKSDRLARAQQCTARWLCHSQPRRWRRGSRRRAARRRCCACATRRAARRYRWSAPSCAENEALSAGQPLPACPVGRPRAPSGTGQAYSGSLAKPWWAVLAEPWWAVSHTGTVHYNPASVARAKDEVSSARWPGLGLGLGLGQP